MTNIPEFIWLIAIPLLAAPIVYLVGRIAILRRARSFYWLAPWLAFLILALTWMPFIVSASDFLRGGERFLQVGIILLHFDGVSMLMTATVLLLSTLVTLFSRSYLQGEDGEEKYYAMLLTMTGVMIALSCAGDLFNLWIWFEAMAVSSYLLVTFYRNQPATLEAGVKYVVQSASGSALVLIGIALVLMQTGTVNLKEIHEAALSGNGVLPSHILLVAGGLMIAGFGVKAALVPFHTWLPDAHSQAPSGISAMLSGVVIESGLIAMLRAIAPLVGAGGNHYPASVWGVILLAAGAVNMLVGNLMALRQKQVKRLLAYSSLSQMGYIVFGVGVALFAGAAAGAQGSMFHILNHGIMKGLAFLAAGSLLFAVERAIAPKTGEAKPAHTSLMISDLDGAAQRFPISALALSLAVLGLGGLPPLAGFMSKWQIFVAGFSDHNFILGLLVVFAALNSVLSLAYYAPLVNAAYRKQISSALAKAEQIPLTMSVSLVILSLGVVIIGLWPSLVQWLTAPAGAALMASFGLR